MTDTTLHYIVFVYLLGYLALAFGWRTYVVLRRTGRNPFVLASGDDAEGYVGRAFRVVLISCALVVALPLLTPRASAWLGPLAPAHGVAQWLGGLLLAGSMVLLLIAQAQMGASWRVGIDRKHPTSLVQHGLFAWSRNPIFLSMRATLFGLFVLLPSAATLVVLVAGEILMQVQVRLEEGHLRLLHGDDYATYCANVRRWL